MGYTQLQEASECSYWITQQLYNVRLMSLYSQSVVIRVWIMNWCCMWVNVSIRTDCCFSPDDKLILTGTSVKKDEGSGKLVFFDRTSFLKVYEIEVTNAVSFSSIPTTTNTLITRYSSDGWFVVYTAKQPTCHTQWKRHIMNPHVQVIYSQCN